MIFYRLYLGEFEHTNTKQVMSVILFLLIATVVSEILHGWKSNILLIFWTYNYNLVNILTFAMKILLVMLWLGSRAL